MAPRLADNVINADNAHDDDARAAHKQRDGRAAYMPPPPRGDALDAHAESLRQRVGGLRASPQRERLHAAMNAPRVHGRALLRVG